MIEDRSNGEGGDHEPQLPVDPDLASTAIPRGPHRRRGAQRTILLVVGTSGLLGALARYGLSEAIRTPPGSFTWSTFAINVSGSLLIGLVLVLLLERFPRARVARPLIVTGFLGAYTTFSTYMVDADLLFRSGDLATGIAYTLASMVGGGVAAGSGIALGRLLVRVDRHLEERLE